MPIASYLYGGNENSCFGFPSDFDYSVINGIDTIAPSVIISNDCCCGKSIYGTVQDLATANNEANSNLTKIYMLKDGSSNFTFSYDEFEMGTNAKVNWQLRVIDPRKDALAKLIFVYRSGNTTEKEIEFISHKIAILDTAINFGKFVKIDSTNENVRLFTIKNNSSINYISDKYKIYPVLYSQMNNQKSNFDLVVADDITPINVNQEKSFQIRFAPINYGHFIDSVGFALIDNVSQDTCVIKYDTELRADVYEVYAQAAGVEFGEQIINSIIIGKKLILSNPNQAPFISELPINIVGYEVTGDSIGDDDPDRVFRIMGIENISEQNPIKIGVGGKYEL